VFGSIPDTHIAVIAFFCGQMCKLETLCKKRAFIGNRTFDRCTPQKKQRRVCVFVCAVNQSERLKTKGLNALQ